MAALRQAATRLCERSLQRAQGSSPGRRLMSTSISGKPQSTAAAQDELRMEFEDKKQELFDLCLEMRRTRAFKTMSWEDLQNLRLTTHLAAQVKPNPADAIWRRYRRYRSLYDFQTAYWGLGFLAYTCLGSNKEKAEAKSESNILSDTEGANE